MSDDVMELELDLWDDYPPVKNNHGIAPKIEQITQPIDDAGNDWNEDFELIEALIGTELTLKIAEAFAGSTIYVPKNIFMFKTHSEIRKKYRAGSTYRELSIEYHYTETHIRNIIHRKKAEA